MKNLVIITDEEELTIEMQKFAIDNLGSMSDLSVNFYATSPTDKMIVDYKFNNYETVLAKVNKITKK